MKTVEPVQLPLRGRCALPGRSQSSSTLKLSPSATYVPVVIRYRVSRVSRSGPLAALNGMHRCDRGVRCSLVHVPWRPVDVQESTALSAGVGFSVGISVTAFVAQCRGCRSSYSEWSCCAMAARPATTSRFSWPKYWSRRATAIFFVPMSDGFLGPRTFLSGRSLRACCS